MSDENLKMLKKDERLLLKKLETIEELLSNHVITEIKQNRNLINGVQKEVSLIRQSLNAHKSGFAVLNDRVHLLTEQLKDAKMRG